MPALENRGLLLAGSQIDVYTRYYVLFRQVLFVIAMKRKLLMGDLCGRQ